MAELVNNPTPRKKIRSTDVDTDSIVAKDRDDDALIRATAQRDEAAFSELFLRYEQPAFNLAHHITRDRELAQEAVFPHFAANLADVGIPPNSHFV